MKLNIKDKNITVSEYTDSIDMLTPEIHTLLKGKTLTDQVKHLQLYKENFTYESNYGEEFDNCSTSTIKLEDDKNLESVLVYDGVIVGIKTQVYSKPFTFVLNKKVCVYSSTDEDGPYSRSVSDYVTLTIKK